MLATALWLSGSGLVGAAGCADPCFDDGLGQGGCPELDTESTTSASATEATGEGDASLSQGNGSASASASASADDTVGVVTGDDDGLVCPGLEEVLLPQVPTFQLVVDQSGSMNEDFDGGDSRWEAMESTLVGPGGVVSELQSNIRFGISLYNNPGESMCPNVTTLSPQLDAADEIATLLAMEQPGGDTPTGESIVQVTGELLNDDWEGDKVIVLTTDGEPDTCDNRDPDGQEEVDMVRGVAVDAVSAAFDAGIRSFVISVGTDIAEEHLQDLANAGIGQQPGDPDATFYVANDTASLIDAFNAIVAGLRPCEFPLATPLPNVLTPSCAVTVNDQEVPYDDPDGWTLPDDTTLGLQGAACDAIQQGVVAIRLECACDA